jgi:PucR family transcriptional regulator, purine catabolism regulatory protein
VATLDELRDAVFPDTRVPPGATSPEVSWVRVMKARVPAFDGLEAGDLAIVPASALAVVASDRGDIEALVAACADARVAALLLVESEDAPSGDDDLDVLADSAAVAGVVALRTGHADPAALERSVIGFLVNRGAELDRQAALVEARLEELAIGGVDLAGLVAAVAGFLRRAVALEGPRGAPLAVHAPIDVEDAAAAVAAYHARRRAVALRAPLPAGAGPSGNLVLLGERPATELERVVVGRIAAFLALELARDDELRRARDTAGRVEALPAAGPPWVVLVARQRPPGDDASGAARERARRELRLLAPAARMSLRGDADSLELRAVIAVEPDDPDATLIASRVAASLRRPVALSRPFTQPADRPAAEAAARATLEAVETLSPPAIVARADRLPAYRLLGNLHNVPDGARLARSLLEPLLKGRADVRREHLDTLRAVLDHPGLAEAAAALGVHRNTIAYRVRRIEAVTGWRLADPELRLPLAVALRLVQTDQD